MTPEAKDDARLTEYLLGQMGAEDQARLEEEYLADPDLHDKLRAVERDLIDRYVRGELANREPFERHYLSSPPRRAKVEFARALMHWSARSPGADGFDQRAAMSRFGLGGAFRTWQIAAAVALVLAGSWFVIARRDSASDNGSRIADGSTGAVQPAPPPTPEPVQPSPPPTAAPAPSVATFVLLPSLTRTGGASPALRLDASADVRLQLQLEEPGDYARYRVVLRTAGGKEIWRGDQLTLTRSASGPAIVIIVPSSRLRDDDYTVRVTGVTAGGTVEELSGYAFSTRRR